MNTFAKSLIAVGAGTILATGYSYGDVLYDNTTSDSGNSLSFSNGETIGDEIILANPTATAAFLDGFSFEIYSSESAFVSTGVQMQVQLFANDGAIVNGYASPGTLLFNDSFALPGTPQQLFSGSDVGLIQEALNPNVIAPNQFTLAVTVTGLDASDSLGIELFGPAPTVGNNYGDYWLNDGSWSLLTNSVPVAFGSQFTGTAAPEPSGLYLGGLGLASLGGFTWLRRRQAKQA
jgi:MYXO-CTERM domain-containing protein